jgi:hypothetical protein
MKHGYTARSCRKGMKHGHGFALFFFRARRFRFFFALVILRAPALLFASRARKKRGRPPLEITDILLYFTSYYKINQNLKICTGMQY